MHNFFLPLSLFISIFLLLHNFIIFPPQFLYSLFHNFNIFPPPPQFYYFPSILISLRLLHLLTYSIVFFHPPIDRPHIDPTSTIVKLYKTTTTTTFLLFSLHHNYNSIVFPPPSQPPPPTHFYCFHSFFYFYSRQVYIEGQPGQTQAKKA